VTPIVGDTKVGEGARKLWCSELAGAPLLGADVGEATWFELLTALLAGGSLPSLAPGVLLVVAAAATGTEAAAVVPLSLPTTGVVVLGLGGSTT